MMHSVFGRRPDLSSDADGRARPGTRRRRACPHMLGRFVQVYCDDILIFSGSKTLARDERWRLVAARTDGARDAAPPLNKLLR
jgi:hypothetical protein